MNNTEATGFTGGYYDYYAIDEYRVSAQGADVEMSSPGAHVVATFKSGGNEFSSLTHFGFETENMVTDNLDDALRARAGTKSAVRGFHELHTDLGGPVVKDKFWFYGAYNHFKIDVPVSGVDPESCHRHRHLRRVHGEAKLAVLAERPVHRLRPLEPETEALPRSLLDDSRRVHPGPG